MVRCLLCKFHYEEQKKNKTLKTTSLDFQIQLHGGFAIVSLNIDKKKIKRDWSLFMVKSIIMLTV